MYKLTGEFYLKTRFWGGYDIYVELEDSTGMSNNIWRKGKSHEVAQVIKTAVI